MREYDVVRALTRYSTLSSCTYHTCTAPTTSLPLLPAVFIPKIQQQEWLFCLYTVAKISTYFLVPGRIRSYCYRIGFEHNMPTSIVHCNPASSRGQRATAGSLTSLFFLQGTSYRSKFCREASPILFDFKYTKVKNVKIGNHSFLVFGTPLNVNICNFSFYVYLGVNEKGKSLGQN